VSEVVGEERVCLAGRGSRWLRNLPRFQFLEHIAVLVDMSGVRMILFLAVRAIASLTCIEEGYSLQISNSGNRRLRKLNVLSIVFRNIE
jgi:hypothetical protein